MVSINFREMEISYQEGISWDVLRQQAREKINIPDELLSDAEDIISSVVSCLDEGMSAAFTYGYELLFVRIFDGEKYIFPLPFMLTDGADIKRACLELSEYARREMIPLIISDIPREELCVLQELFPHIDANCYLEDDDSFVVKVNSECDLLDEWPSIEDDDIALTRISDEDIDEYALLCSDRELNKYWGYDVCEDNPDASKQFYLDVAEREFYDGVAITLGIRFKGDFAGEAVIYDFDYRGSAQIAVRVLPKYHGKGVGTRATKNLIALAKKIGLSSVKAEIINENSASIKMTSKVMGLGKVDGNKTIFSLTL